MQLKLLVQRILLSLCVWSAVSVWSVSHSFWMLAA